MAQGARRIPGGCPEVLVSIVSPSGPLSQSGADGAVSHAAVQLGKSLFPLFAAALDLPENFFDDKVGRCLAHPGVTHRPRIC